MQGVANGRGTKRAAPPDEAVIASLREQLLDKMAALLAKPKEEMVAALAAAPSATVLELGLTSAMGIALKGWVFKELEAELTTFQLLKQPLIEAVEAIGGHISPFPARLPPPAARWCSCLCADRCCAASHIVIRRCSTKRCGGRLAASHAIGWWLSKCICGDVATRRLGAGRFMQAF